MYGMSKRQYEELGRDYSRQWGVTTVALRQGSFVPTSFERYGFGLLCGDVDDRDVSQAVLRALEATPAGGFDCFNIMADVPFTPTDARALHADAASVLERYYPGVGALVEARRLNLAELIDRRIIWSITKAKRELTYQPQYNFAGFLRALATGDTSYYPSAGVPWSGV
jgi:UDP-glucose 4-epimerase